MYMIHVCMCMCICMYRSFNKGSVRATPNTTYNNNWLYVYILKPILFYLLIILFDGSGDIIFP